MFKKIATLTTAAILTLGGAAAASATAAAELEIGTLGYNANGADVAANAWKEYVDIHNVSGHAVNIKGWSTQDTWADTANGDTPKFTDCNTAVFEAGSGAGRFQHLTADNPDTDAVETEGLWLPKGEYIRVYTGGSVDAKDNNWHTIALNKSACGYNGHYLGNVEDGIKLKNAAGVLVASKTYSFENGYYVR